MCCLRGKRLSGYKDMDKERSHFMYSTISLGSLSFLTSLLRDTLNVYGFNTRNKFVMWLKRKKNVKPNLHFYISLTTPLVSGAQARLNQTFKRYSRCLGKLHLTNPMFTWQLLLSSWRHWRRNDHGKKNLELCSKGHPVIILRLNRSFSKSKENHGPTHTVKIPTALGKWTDFFFKNSVSLQSKWIRCPIWIK